MSKKYTFKDLEYLNNGNPVKKNTPFNFICSQCGKPYTIQAKAYLRRLNNNATFKDMCMTCARVQSNKDNHGGVMNNQTKEYHEKVKATCRKKFGTDYYMQTDEFKQRTKATCLEKYGVENVMQDESIRKSQRESTKVNWGSEFYLQTEQGKECFKNTMLKRYGVEHPLCLDAFMAKAQNTNFSHNGGMWNTQTEEAKKHSKEVCLQKYGVESYSQVNIPEKSLSILQDKDLFKAFLESHKGESFDTLGNILEVSPCTVRNYLRNYDLQSSYAWVRSKGENQLYDFILSLGDYNIIVNDRSTIAPLELDLYLPSQSLALEFDGTYWHRACNLDNRINNVSGKYYHQSKSLLCSELGIRLIHIPEFLWDDTTERLTLEVLIRQALGLSKSIDADICRVVHKPDAYVLFYGDTQVYELQYQSIGSDEWVLHSIYNRNFLCKNAISNCLALFENEKKPKYIYYELNLLFGEPTNLESLGFHYLEATEPDYVWTHSRQHIISRAEAEQMLLSQAEYSDEESFMESQGYERIYDAGNAVYIKEYK